MLGIKLNVAAEEIYQFAVTKLTSYNIPPSLAGIVMDKVHGKLQGDVIADISMTAANLAEKLKAEKEGETNG